MASADRIQFGRCILSRDSGELSCGGQVIPIQKQPASILWLLLNNAGELVTRDQIRHHVWSGGEFVDFEHAVNTAMVKIRRLLREEAGRPFQIETISGSGYKLHGPVAEIGERSSPKSHPSFTEAKLCVAQRSPASLQLAYELYLDVLAAFPRSAEVFAEISELNRLLCISECIPSELACERAIAAADSSLACDPSIASPWKARGGTRSRFLWEWEDGEKDLLHAISLDGSSAENYSTYGITLAAQGRFVQAHAMLRKALAASPTAPILHVLQAQTLVAERRYVEAVELLRKVLTVAPDFPLANLTYGLALLGVNRSSEAIVSIRAAQAKSYDQPLIAAYLVYALREDGQDAAAEAESSRLRDLAELRTVASSTMAFLEAIEKRMSEAVAWARRCVETHDPVFAMLRHAPCFDPMQDDAHFAEVLRAMNLTAAPEHT